MLLAALTVWKVLKFIGCFVYDNWKVMVPVILITIVVGYLLFFRGCSKPPPKLNETEIHDAQRAIAIEDRQIQINILAESEAREMQIDQSRADADAQKAKAIEESKKKWANADNQAMADELNRRASQ